MAEIRNSPTQDTALADARKTHGGSSASPIFMIGQLMPQSTAISASRAIASTGVPRLAAGAAVWDTVAASCGFGGPAGGGLTPSRSAAGPRRAGRSAGAPS